MTHTSSTFHRPVAHKSCVVSSDHISVYIFTKHGVDIFVCQNCGCIMADIGFEPLQYEESTYYTMLYNSVAEIEAVWGFRWRHILRSIRKERSGNNLLDVGAGNGFFVSIAQKEFSYQSTGVELSAAEVSFAKRLFATELAHGDAASVPGQFSVVTAFNVIEHVEKPFAFFAELVRKTDPGGLVVMTTPNPVCIHRRLKGVRKWPMVNPPHHINLLSRSALLEFGARLGLVPLHYSTLSTYIRALRQFDTSTLILRRTVFRLLQSMNLGADHFFIFRKQEF